MQQLFCQRIRNSTALAVFAGLAVLATVAAGQQPNGEIQREKMTERAEEDDQTQKNADFTGSQRSALETELKKAQEKAQLAQKIADLVAGQFHAEESRLPNGEPPQKSANLSANQPKSGQTQPPNTGPKVEPLTSTQPVDSSAQSAETTASVPIAAEENKGIGSAEATAAIPLEASPTPKNEPVTRDQQPPKLTRINQRQSAVT